MHNLVAVLVVWIAAAGLAVAQAPTTESVTVTQTREAIAKFIQTFAKPTRLVGKLARWETPICPVTLGVKAEANDFVTNRDERARLTTFAHPIQALYSTATRDLRGQINVDTGMRRGGRGVTIILPCAMTGDGLAGGSPATPGASGVPIVTPKLCARQLPNAIKTNVTGSRIGDGLRSSFEHIIIIVDPRQIAAQELGAISDYVAMLALTQTTPPEGCVSLPSIANLLAPGCGEPVKGLTPGDMAYLRGLYRMDASAFLGGQKSAISWEMEQALGERE